MTSTQTCEVGLKVARRNFLNVSSRSLSWGTEWPVKWLIVQLELHNPSDFVLLEEKTRGFCEPNFVYCNGGAF